MTGTFHVWQDGKGILVVDGEPDLATMEAIREAFRQADDIRVMVFPFPVEVVHEKGPLTFVGVGTEVPT